MAKLTKMVCGTCGSDDVKADAYATWSTTRQRWECADTFDKGAVCEKCGGETTLEERPLTGKAYRLARARELALEHGWQPGDEDTATQYCEMEGLSLSPPRHAFEAVQVDRPGVEAILDTFRVTKKRPADVACRMAEELCQQARDLAHKPAAFVREINAPGEEG